MKAAAGGASPFPTPPCALSTLETELEALKGNTLEQLLNMLPDNTTAAPPAASSPSPTSSPSTAPAADDAGSLSVLEFLVSTPPQGKPFDYNDLVKAFMNTVSPAESERTLKMLCELPRREISQYLSDARRARAKMDGQKKGLFKRKMAVSFEPASFLDFGVQGRVPLHTEVTQTIVVTKRGGPRGTVTFPNATNQRFKLSFEPQELVLKRKGDHRVNVTLVFTTTTKLNTHIRVDVEGLGPYFFVLQLESEKSLFGVDPDELETMTIDGRNIPAVLVTMKNYVYENGGFQRKGIFRAQVDESSLMAAKNQLSKKTFVGCKDVNIVSNLLATWFRELPEPLLISLPVEDVLGCDDVDAFRALLATLPESKRHLFGWLMDLLLDVAISADRNKMGPPQLAQLFAPTLHGAPSLGAEQAFGVTSKIAAMVTALVQERL